jgi:hypothetical protein
VPPQTHFPLTQLSAWVELQVTHAPPTDPQAPVLVPGWQFPWASQQPLEQLHTHFPFWHTVPLGQSAPVVPQTHFPFIQLSAWVELQVTQKLPADPQALVFVPGWQNPLAQQPVEQPALQAQTPLAQ